VSVATSKDIQRNRKELIVNPAGVEGKNSHQEEKIPDVVNIWKHLFSSTVIQQPYGKG